MFRWTDLSAFGLLAAAIGSQAQDVDTTAPSAPTASPTPGTTGAPGTANGTAGAGTPGKRALTVTTAVTLAETATNNVYLSPDNKRSELITQVTPSIEVHSNAGRIQGSFNYALTGIWYARNSESTAIQQSLAANGRAEAIENFAYLDAAANISRANVSAFGQQSPDSSLRTGNQTEVRTYNLSPFIQGRLGNFANYTARLGYSATSTGSSQIGNSSGKSGSVHVGSEGLSLWSWGLDAQRQTADFSQGRDSESDSQIATLGFNPDYELHFNARGGREADNYLSFSRESHSTYGGGVQWTPSDRASVTAQYDRHFYGNTYTFNAVYRTARTAWTFNDSRAVVTNAGAASLSTPQTAYNLIYLQLASLYPDPSQRANQTLLELNSLGLNPNSLVSSGFLANSIYLQRSQSLSFAYLGLLTSVIVTAQLADSSQLDTVTPGVDSISSAGSVRQRSVSVNLSRRLTPISSANLNVSQGKSTSKDTGLQSNLTTINANWNTQLGRRTTASLGARHSIAGGDFGYTEWAILGSLSMQF